MFGLFDYRSNRGRASVHNALVEESTGNIVIFTDSETIFKNDFLSHLLPHFSDPSVGAVSGRIYYLNKDQSSIGESAGIYWKYEEMIRIAESRLGILAFGTGAALAFRKNAYKPISPSEDIDYAGTLACIRLGYKAKYEPCAIAYDYISETSLGAFQTRVRQTRKSFLSIIHGLFDEEIIFKRPVVFFTGLFHKTFRHLTPYFLVVNLLLNYLIIDAGMIYKLTFVFQLLFLCIFAYRFWDEFFS